MHESLEIFKFSRECAKRKSVEGYLYLSTPCNMCLN